MNRSRIDQIERKARAFSLVELLVVIFIIAVLIGLLIPAISKVRQNAHRTDTQQFITQLAVAIENYQSEFRAYPGPLTDDQIYNTNNTAASFTPNFGGATTTSTNFDTTSQSTPQMMQKFTMGENLVLGLLGGLKLDMTVPANPLFYDPSLVGSGPNSLNPANPKRFNPYFDAVNLSWRNIQQGALTVKTGKYEDGAGFADDTIVPEFVDRFPDPMPILYLRAKRGVAQLPVGQAPTATVNSVISYVLAPNPATNTLRTGTYDISQIVSYTGAYTGDSMTPTLDSATPPSDASRSLGVGKHASGYMKGTSGMGMASSNWYHGLRTVDPTATMTSGANYVYPFDAYSYFQNPASPGSARNKDTYILISAGVDRIYGTRDDVVSFGTVGE